MKPFRLLATLTASALCTHFPTHAGEPAGQQPPAPQGAAVAISIVDDHSGGMARGALNALTAPELEGLLALPGREAVAFHYILVQERSNEAVSARLDGWTPPDKMPELPDASLPAAMHEQKLREYYVGMNQRRSSHQVWKKGALEKFAAFQKESATAQAKLEHRWQIRAESRSLRDWNCSDIEGAVLLAAEKAAGAARCYVLLATDGRNLPGEGKPRTKPFTAAELNPAALLVWIVPDGKAPPAPLFAGLANRTLTATSLGEAVSAVVAEEKAIRQKKSAGMPDIPGTASK